MRSAPRRVSIERSGGFAGLKAHVELDASALTQAQHAALIGLLRGTGVRAPSMPPPCGTDEFSYRVEVVDVDGACTRVSLTEAQMPDTLGALCRPTLP